MYNIKTDVITCFLSLLSIKSLSIDVCNEKKGNTEIIAKTDKNKEYSPKSVFDNAIDINFVIIKVVINSIKKLPITKKKLYLLLLLKKKFFLDSMVQIHYCKYHSKIFFTPSSIIT